MDFDQKPSPEVYGNSLAPAPPLSYADTISTTIESIRHGDSIYGRETSKEEAYDAHNDRIYKELGVRLPNPMRELVDPEGGLESPSMRDPSAELGYAGRLHQLAEKHPDKRDLIDPEHNFLADAVRIHQTTAADEADAQRRSTNPFAATSAQLIGGLVAGSVDPINIASMLPGIAVGGGVGLGLAPVLLHAAKWGGGINAAASLATQPFANEWRRESGMPEMTLGERGMDVATSFLFGMGADAGVRGIARGYHNVRGHTPILGVDGGVEGWRKGAIQAPTIAPESLSPAPTIDPDLLARATQGDAAAQAEIAAQTAATAAPKLPEGLNGTIVKKALSGDLEALRTVGEKTGLIEDPTFSGALVAAELHSPAELETKTALAAMGIDDGEGLRALAQAIRAAGDDDMPPTHGFEPHTVKAAELAPEAGAALNAEHGPHIATLAAELAKTRPELAGLVRDAVDAGIAEALPAIRAAAEHISDGKSPATAAKTFAEQVLELSGGNPEQALTVARIKAGVATVPEIARGLRSGLQLDSATPVTASVQMAKSLARLSDHAFDMVEAGEARPDMAAMVADRVVDPADHAGAIRDIAKMGITDPQEAARLLPDILPYRGQDATNIILGVKKEPGSQIEISDNIVDPSGPAAKKQTERMANDLAAEIKQATADGPPPLKPPATAEDALAQAESVRQAIAEVAGPQPVKPPSEFIDKESGLELSRDEVGVIVDMWSYVQSMKTQKKPQSLSQWIMANGRVQDEHGEISNILGGKSRHLISGKGKTLDDAALAAFESGFFLHRPSVSEFIEAIDRDAHGDSVYSVNDYGLADDLKVAGDMRDDLSKLGLDHARTEQDIYSYFARQGTEGRGDRQADIATAPSGEESKVRSAIAEVAGIVPPEVRVETFSSVADLPAAVQADVIRANGQAFADALRRFQSATTEAARDRARLDLDAIKDGRGIEGISHDGTIWIAQYALNPKGKIAHELLHALKALGKITAGEIRILAERARKIGAFNEARESLYRKELEARGLTPERVTELLDEEAAAHLIEARAQGQSFGPQPNFLIDRIRLFLKNVASALKLRGFDKSDQVMQALFSGEMAKRAGKVDASEPMFSMRDTDELGFYSKALEAAKSLKQAKGTPEQMLAMMKSAGVKDAEIKATRLDKLLASRETNASSGSGAVTGTADVWGPKFQKLMSQEYRTAVAGEDLSTQLDILSAKYFNAPNDPPEMRAAIGQEIIRLRKELGPEWMAKYAPDAPAITPELAPSNGDRNQASTSNAGRLNSITRDEIIQHLEDNRVQLKEVNYGPPASVVSKAALSDAATRYIDGIHQHYGYRGVDIDTLRDAVYGDIESAEEYDRPTGHLFEILDAIKNGLLRDNASMNEATKWSQHSLDPSNPTYQETVLHLPDPQQAELDRLIAERSKLAEQITPTNRATPRGMAELSARIEELQDQAHESRFTSGHFDEPNIIADIQWSLQKDADGNVTFVPSQIQSDWGQNIRDGTRAAYAKDMFKTTWDELSKEQKIAAQKAIEADHKTGTLKGGIRNEARIAELKEEAATARLEFEQVKADEDAAGFSFGELEQVPYGRAKPFGPKTQKAYEYVTLLEAELRTVEAASPGHPLVNTTGQWTTTALRRIIRLAVQSEADSISIPSGKTVLSYNPGKEHGMEGFYNDIVPQSLKKILTEIDPSTTPRKVETVTSHDGHRQLGQGFTTFPITDKIREAFGPDHAQPMFSMRDTSHLDMTPEARKQRAEEQGYDTSKVWYHGTQRLDRLVGDGKLNPKRATSGPMPFFTNDPEVASRYAASKPDTSRMKEDDRSTVANYFTVESKNFHKGTRSQYTVEQSWNYLSPEQRATIADRAKRIGYKNPETAEGPIVLHPEGVDASLSSSHYDWLLKNEERGNHLAALRNIWHDGGNLIGDEEELVHIYKLAGYPYEISQKNAPWITAEGVLPVYLKMRNPLRTEDTANLAKVAGELEDMFKRDRTRETTYSDSDAWDKNHRYTPKSWVAALKDDIANNTTYSFTSIPDKVTNALRQLGYDGILDRGGKYGGTGHDVAIPFDAHQARSVNAAFDPAQSHSPNLMFAMRNTDHQQPELKNPLHPEHMAELTGHATTLLHPYMTRKTGMSFERDADGHIKFATKDGQRFEISRDDQGQITGMIPQDPTELAAPMIDMLTERAKEYGYHVDGDKMKIVAAELPNIVKIAQEGDQALTAQAINNLVMKVMGEPDEPLPHAGANDNGPASPLRQDLADLGRMDEMSKIVSGCRQ